MKKITFLVATVLLLGNVAKASEIIKQAGVVTMNRLGFDEPISFTERGIVFFVFPNGDFDFNTRPDDSQGTYQYKQAGRRTTMVDRRIPENYGVQIEYDSFGRVRRVGNTFINYDFQDRVSRIGTVFMRYNRFALAQVGGLQLVYNRNGEIIDRIGQVKGNRNYGYTYYGTPNGYNHTNQNYYDANYNSTNYNYDDSNYTNDNNNYYYYKANGTRGKIEDHKREDNN